MDFVRRYITLSTKPFYRFRMDLKTAACLYNVKVIIPRLHNTLPKYCFVKIIIKIIHFVKFSFILPFLQAWHHNFSLLVSTCFTKPFKEPIAYGKYVARLANILSGGVLVQRLGDLLQGQRSTQARIERNLVRPTLKGATPGDLSFVLPYRHLTGIIEMLQALDKLAPGVGSRHTLLYGVEVKFYSCRLRLTSNMETEVHNLFAVGDGAGVSRGLVQASASGVVAAREILKRTAHKVSPGIDLAESTPEKVEHYSTSGECVIRGELLDSSSCPR